MRSSWIPRPPCPCHRLVPMTRGCWRMPSCRPEPQTKVTAPSLDASMALIIAPDLADLPPPLPIFAQAGSLASLAAGPGRRRRPQPGRAGGRQRQICAHSHTRDVAEFRSLSLCQQGEEWPAGATPYVFRKDGNGALTMAYDWAASTGGKNMRFRRSVFMPTPSRLPDFISSIRRACTGAIIPAPGTGPCPTHVLQLGAVW